MIKMLKMFLAIIIFLIFTVFCFFFFNKALYIKINIQKQPHQLSTSVILAGGLTIYKEDIIQCNLSQRLSYQQGPVNLKDHCQVSFIKIANHLEAFSYQLAMTHEISEHSHWLQCSVTNCNYCLVATSTLHAAFNP